jgi:hypothetical protein
MSPKAPDQLTTVLSKDDQVGRWQWHPQVREVWGNERLYFWRLSFPTYDRSGIVFDIQRVMERSGVLAYAVYELYGSHDVLLRAWLPTAQGVFESAFLEVFRSDPNIVIEAFSINEIVTHWPWADEHGAMRPLDDGVLADRLPNREIQRINAGLNLAELATYQERGLLAPAWHSQGIKFGLVVGPSRQAMPQAAERRISGGLLRTLMEADDQVFTEKSLYRGIGFGSYLILARVEASAFHRIESEITEPINALIAPETFGSRTTTFVTSTEDLLYFEDQMRVTNEAPVKRSAHEWLQDEESQHLEVKGSAFLDLDHWLLAEDAPNEPPESDVPTESLMKAICGFLNAEGGTVILGALEQKRYAASPRLVDLPRVGEYVVRGLQPEYGGDWDRYALRLRDIIAARIRPDANDFVDLDRGGVGTGPLCVITVRAPHRSPSVARWFWHFPKKGGAGPHFWVREGNRTKPKIGPDIDDYQAEKTRRATDFE